MRCPFLRSCEKTLRYDVVQRKVGGKPQGLPWGLCKNGDRDWHCPHYDELNLAIEYHTRNAALHEETLSNAFHIGHLNRMGGYHIVYRELR